MWGMECDANANIFCYLPNKTAFGFMWPSYMYIAFALLYVFYKVDKRINLQLICCFCREETKYRIKCEIWASSKSFLLHPQQHAFGISSLIFHCKVILYLFLLFYYSLVSPLVPDLEPQLWYHSVVHCLPGRALYPFLHVVLYVKLISFIIK